jgi:hypothetical protein
MIELAALDDRARCPASRPLGITQQPGLSAERGRGIGGPFAAAGVR